MTNISELRHQTTHQLTTFDAATRSKTLPVKRGETLALPEVTGSGFIAQIWLTFPGWFWQHWEPEAPASCNILKTLILRIFWDGADKPAVEAPVGDFFGNGLCEMSNFASQYFGMSSGGFFCKFPMPFQRGFRVELENLDEAIDTYVFVNVLYQLTGEEAPQASYFHAHFSTGRNAGPDPITLLDAKGRGHYVGCTLSMQGQQRNYLSFLEAPEFVGVDDDWEPARIAGTGLEDYFLGGWYFRDGAFTGPLHGVPAKDAFDSSIAMYRVHEADAIHFERRLRFQFINPWDPERLSPFAYSAVAFCYLDSPHGQAPELPGRDDLLCWYRYGNKDHASVP